MKKDMIVTSIHFLYFLRLLFVFRIVHVLFHNLGDDTRLHCYLTLLDGPSSMAFMFGS